MIKKAILTLLLMLSFALCRAQYYYYPIRFGTFEFTNADLAAKWNMSVGVYPYVSYVEGNFGLGASLLSGRMIVDINEVSTLNMSEERLYQLLQQAPQINIRTYDGSKWMFDGMPSLVPMEQVCREVHAVSAMKMVKENFKATKYPLFLGCTLGLNEAPCDIYRDMKSGAFSTFDFEFSEGGCPAVEKKKFAEALQENLTQKGFKYDPEHPDMLVLVELFSNRSEQYVPPTQSINTQYKYGYQLFSGWGTRQYITSTQQGGYTDVKFMNKFALTVMDVAKLKAGAKTPPVIYSATSSQTGTNEIAASVYAIDKLPIMTSRLSPFGCYVSRFNFADKGKAIGIAVDRNDMNRVVMVDAGSPAAIAGFQIGDRIVSYGGSWISDKKNRIGVKIGRNKNEVVLTPEIVQFPTFEELKVSVDSPVNPKGKSFILQHPAANRFPLAYVSYCADWPQIIFTVNRGGTPVELTVNKYMDIPYVITSVFLK